jgi:hypothetical protein
MSRLVLDSVTMSPRRGLIHRALKPFHEIRRHPREEGVVYCRTCYVVRGVRDIRRGRASRKDGMR